MAKSKTAYVCNQCGAEYTKWQGQCEACGAWNTLSEFIVEPAAKSGASRNGGSLMHKSSSPRKDVRTNARSSRTARKPALSAGAKAGNSKRYGFTAPRQRTKKRG